MNNYKGPLNSELGIAKIPPAVNQNIQNLASQVASIHPYRSSNVNEIVPAPPENARKQTPYPSPQLSSSSNKDYLTPRSQDSSENISRSSSPGVSNISRSSSPGASLAEIALAMEVNEKNKNGELVQNYFIPENLGR